MTIPTATRLSRSEQAGASISVLGRVETYSVEMIRESCEHSPTLNACHQR